MRKGASVSSRSSESKPESFVRNAAGRPLLEEGQGAVGVKVVPHADYAEERHGDAQIEVAISLLVHSHALTHVDQEEFLGAGTSTSAWTQALSPDLTHGTQVACGNGQARWRVRSGWAYRTRRRLLLYRYSAR